MQLISKGILENVIGELVRRTDSEEYKLEQKTYIFSRSNFKYKPLKKKENSINGLIVTPSHPDAFQTLLNLPDNRLRWFPASQVFPPGYPLPFNEPVPVLIWGEGYEDGSKPFVERREDGTVVFYADIIASSFFMLSRWEETVNTTRDLHGRFPATASVAYKHGFLDRPIVDEYVLILQAWIKEIFPDWKYETPKFSVKLSHDIDSVQRYANFYRMSRVFAGDLLKRRNWKMALNTAKDSIRAIKDPGQDPHIQGIDLLADLSEQYGFQSAFYFMSAQKSDKDGGYDLSSPIVKSRIEDLQRRGHEIGFHSGYYTYDNYERFAQEKTRIEKILGNGKIGGRQHYLRFRAPDTWRIWEQNGMEYDSTLSYADHEGFRCGTCHPFHPWDLEKNRPMDILEIPLIVMDGTLRQYRKLTPQEGEERILTLAQRCKNVNGVFTLLWHNTSLFGDWKEWGDMYQRVLPKLAKLRDEGNPCAS